MNSSLKNLMLCSTAAIALFAMPAAAQDTSAEIRGDVETSSGALVAGATVKIKLLSTGSVQTFTTSASGSFVARGLRVGGPYTVTVTKDGETAIYENVFLRLGQPFRVNAVLGSAANDMEEIVVTGSKNAMFQRMGPGSSFSRDDIDNTASSTRDMKDVLRKNPLVNLMSNDSFEMSVAGVNPRYNSLTVDGVRQNDDFGLNGSGYPTQNAPISIDAISNISIETAPFSASKGGFTGAQVNVVTKSGTNDFHGTAFFEYMSDATAGSRSQIDEIDLDFTQKFYGATLGGPIIKDKLFFFFSYDHFESPQSFPWGPAGSGAANETFANISDMNEVIRIAQEVYGIDAGVPDAPVTLTDDKYLAKLDWNINDDHRASFTYQLTDGNQTGNTTSSPFELRLSSHWYNRADRMEMMVGQVFSNWSDNFSTEVKVGHKSVGNTQEPLFGAGVGQVVVDTDSGEIALGVDRSRHANELSTDYLTAMVKATYLLGDHEITGGWERDTLDVFNIFVQDALGSWEFSSLEDFENGQADRFDYQNAFTNNSTDAGAQFKFTYNNFYLEDRWNVNNALTVNFGLRYETIATDDRPRVNDLFAARYGFENTNTLDGKDIIMPRMGFNWVTTDRLTIRGGAGKFSGGRPNVWISNAFTNDGVTIVRPDRDAYDYDAVLANPDFTSIPQSVLDAMAPGNGDTTPVDPNFKLPYDWKFSLAADYVADLGPLGDDWNITLEAQFTQRNNGVRWVDLARTPFGVDSTGRPLYVPFDPLDDHVPTSSTDDNGYDRYDLMLTNGPGGHSEVFAIDIGKKFDNGVTFNIAYAHQNVENAVSGTSSTATSNFQFDPHLDRQNPQIGTAPYEIKHRVTWSFAYNPEIFQDAKTTISLFGEHRTGRPFSWTLGSFRDDGFGDQTNFDDSDYYLPYIPSSRKDGVGFSDSFTYNDFIALVNEAGLSEYVGSFVPRNSETVSMVHRVDLKIKQEIPTFSGQKVEVYFDMRNLLNFLDADWGREEGARFGSNNAVLVDWSIDDAGQISYRAPFGGLNPDGPLDFRVRPSIWQMKLGVRYKF